MTPWDHHSDLQRDRLVRVGQLIHQARNDALDRFSPELGSNAWTLGCEAFAFGVHRITSAEVEHEWLSVLQSGMQFVFSVGNIPVRFYKGAPDDPNKRTLRQTFSEIHQLSLFGLDEIASADLIYRFAVETDFDGAVAAITFVMLHGDVAVLTWPIPLDETVVRFAPADIAAPEGVDLPKPMIRKPVRANAADMG